MNASRTYATAALSAATEESNTPAVPARARTLRAGQVLRRVWDARSGTYKEWVETRSRTPASRTVGRASPPPGVVSSPPPAGRGYGYKWVSPGDAPHRVRVAAKSALLVARDALLGGRQPRLAWFRFARPNEEPDFTDEARIMGTANRLQFCIGIRADLHPLDVRESVWHECAHLSGQGEQEAEATARRLVLAGL